ncbi:hypothetical protein [Homoserinimonas sp. OAct 916]|uniref:hypothetical protein n=1 Tax=Homoserinimonas sp. OAct 916 TaxID=2211450 RepID=UPI000DBE26A3|nr:hypothetical protein [Homoserinimonas sp. OAct 916]
MTTRWARFVRGWLTAILAVFVAALFHLAAGGAAPGWLGVSIALGFSGMLSVILAGKTVSLARITIAVAFAQLLLHIMFSLDAAAGGMTVTGNAHHGPVSITFAESAGAATAHAHFDGWMIVSHAAAALITIAAVYRGERSFWALARQGAERLTLVFIGAFTPVVVPGRACLYRIALLLSLTPAGIDVPLSSRQHRGPPRLIPGF